MQRRSLWETLGFAVAAGLLVILLLPTVRSLFGNPAGPGQQRAGGPEQGVLATLGLWLDRLPDLSLTGPGGLFTGCSGLQTLAIVVLAVALLVLAPRLVLIGGLLVVGFLLLEPILDRFSGPAPRGSNGTGRADSWIDLVPGHLGRTDILILLGIAVAIAFLISQRRPREERFAGDNYRARAREEE